MPTPRLVVAVAVVLSSALLGCGDGSDPADVAGLYTIGLTNRENGCNLGSWNVGETTPGVMVDISQNGVAVSADVQGAARIGLEALLAGHVLTGTVAGDHLTLAIIGTRGNTMGACAYTFDANLAADVTGDTINGAIVYQAKTNASPDCGTLTGCSSRQDFAGARPPQ